MPAAVVKDGTGTPKVRQKKFSPAFLTPKFSLRNSALANITPPPPPCMRRRRGECFPALGATGASCTGCGATAHVDEVAQRAPHPLHLPGVRPRPWGARPSLRGSTTCAEGSQGVRV